MSEEKKLKLSLDFNNYENKFSLAENFKMANDFLLCNRSYNYCKLNKALNQTILLNSAFYIESCLESKLRLISSHYEILLSNENISINLKKYFENLNNHIMEYVSKSTSLYNGIDIYFSFFKTMIDIDIKKMLNEKNKTLYKAVELIFKLRNRLAHGRPVSATFFGTLTSNAESDLKMKYNEIFGLLIDYYNKNNIVFVKSIFSSEIADFYWNLSQAFIHEVFKIIDENFLFFNKEYDPLIYKYKELFKDLNFKLEKFYPFIKPYFLSQKSKRFIL